MRHKRENRLSANDIGVSGGGRESEGGRGCRNVKQIPLVLGREGGVGIDTHRGRGGRQWLEAGLHLPTLIPCICN